MWRKKKSNEQRKKGLMMKNFINNNRCNQLYQSQLFHKLNTPPPYLAFVCAIPCSRPSILHFVRSTYDVTMVENWMLDRSNRRDFGRIKKRHVYYRRTLGLFLILLFFVRKNTISTGSRFLDVRKSGGVVDYRSDRRTRWHFQIELSVSTVKMSSHLFTCSYR